MGSFKVKQNAFMPTSLKVGASGSTITNFTYGNIVVTVGSAVSGSVVSVASSGFTGAPSTANFQATVYVSTGSFAFRNIAPSSAGVAALVFANFTGSTAASTSASVNYTAIW